MAEIEIITEHETEHGWSFTLRLGHGANGTLHTIKLGWADYEHWTHGSLPPARVAEAIVRVAIESLGDSARPECFDAGRLSREINDFPAKLATALESS